jgi:pimeloyl-ACP methyl ester carboxylesterase
MTFGSSHTRSRPFGARPRTKRSRILRWLKRIALACLALTIIMAGTGAIFEAVSRQKATKNYPPKGQLVDIGGRRIHLDCRGHGSPTILLEAGSDSFGSLSWARVHDRLASRTRTCAYDRAGIMWSDRAYASQDGEAVARDLHIALGVAGERGPFLFVGHSLGALYTLIYTRTYPGEVVGLVLVDPGHPGQEKQIDRFPALAATSGTLAGFQSILAALSWTGLPRLVAPAGAPPHAPRSVVEQSTAYYGKSLDGLLAGLEGIDRTMAQAAASRDLGDIPTIVLGQRYFLPGAMGRDLGLSPDETARFNAEWAAFREDLASWSTRGQNQIVDGSGHYIQFDQPQRVVAAVDEVMHAALGPHR